MPPKLVEVAQVRTEDGPTYANAYLKQGWTLISITGDHYHFGRYEADPAEEQDWRRNLAEWLDNLDPDEVDRQTLEGLGLGDPGGAAAYIRTFKQMLGLPDAPQDVEWFTRT